MSEDQRFAEWFNQWRTERWLRSRPDEPPTPSDAYCQAFRPWMKVAWLARASLPTDEPRTKP